MGFLTQDDYSPLIKDVVLAQVMDNDMSIVTDAERFAQSQIESYLNQRFDVASIFSQTGVSRDQSILMYMIDITLYHIHARINPSRIPEIRVKRYDDAIKWMEMVSTGKLTPALPTKIDPNTGEADTKLNTSRFGSNEKFNHRF